MTAAADGRPGPRGPVGETTELAHGHLHQVDVVRLLTFGSVIAVHVIAAITPGQSLPARGTLMLLHFTRETFFVITGFVLLHTYDRRPLDTRVFWRRRYLLIGVPYLVWSAVYWWEHVVLGTDHGSVTAAGLRTLALQLVTGTAEYHLYFLLVSMQVYLIFPWLLWGVRRTRGHHRTVLTASALLQLLTFWFLHDQIPSWSPRPGWVTWLVGYSEQLLPSYQFYVVAGALAAANLDRVQGWVLRHPRLIAATVASAAVLTEGGYLLQVATGTPPARASEVLQPVMIVWTMVVTTGVLALGLRFAQRRRPGPVASMVAEGSRISFGVFLVHPLVISVLIGGVVGAVAARPGQPWTTVVLWAATVLVSVAVVEVVAHTPVSMPLTGRSWTRRRRGAPAGPRTPAGERPAPTAPRPSPARSTGPSPAGSPTTTRTTSPVGSPTTSPVGSPTTSPVGSPTTSPVGSPTTSPVGSRTTSPAGSPTDVATMDGTQR